MMESKQWTSRSAKETRRLAASFAEQAKAGDVYALSGDLGAGKTVFAQGFAEGLGVKAAVISPTFTILHLYEEGRLPLYHLDVYRLEEAEELEEVGIDDCFYGSGVAIVEWAENVAEALPPATQFIDIKRLAGDENLRLITLRQRGEEK